MSQRKKLWKALRDKQNKNVRLDELLALAKYLGFDEPRVRGADYVLTHEGYPFPVLIGRPHARRKHLWPHDVNRFVEAVEWLVERGFISGLGTGEDDVDAN